jgi:predicted GNAT family N-acyltransferase
LTPEPLHGLTIKLVERATVRALQWRVLRGGELPVDSSSIGVDIPGSFSVAAWAADGVLVGAATLIPEPEPDLAADATTSGQWRLRGMATAHEAQGQGVGGAVLAAGLAEVVRQEGRRVWCNARTSALGFYRGHGFTVVGEEFVTPESGIPHHRARLDLRTAAAAGRDLGA